MFTENYAFFTDISRNPFACPFASGKLRANKNALTFNRLWGRVDSGANKTFAIPFAHYCAFYNSLNLFIACDLALLAMSMYGFIDL